MFNKPEEAKMTVEEAESYGRKINARSAQYENVEFAVEEAPVSDNPPPPPLSEEEILKRVGRQNYKNMIDGDSMQSINS